jgi:HSP20 family protein
MKKEEIQISVENNELIVRGTRQRQEETSDRSFHRVERMFGAFERTFSLPGTLITDKVEASYRDGVLEISLPKAEEVKPRQIAIKS